MTLGEFWQAGGLGMYIVALFGLAALLLNARFGHRPDERDLPWLRTMTAATWLAILAAVVANVATVFWVIPNGIERSAWTASLYIGLFESLTPAIVGLGLLLLAAPLRALGLRRLAVR